ncbi:alpha/beta hydrolase [[Actinomadura] parvosata subsp. kistnae]|uniref:Alpha/beta hydrolase n=1 Tax=[Actinomadura] parvosata subsp. kistnae TaxID=1909395 RepID=A0A1U9ZRP8_9ACTN|nr:alpha/beta fold hydrolase [Nonomuraea sp. ATCC 55076]AQZ60613.1 alpha/beta hydrolase [Nonomuraea sp. ATCC 55076]
MVAREAKFITSGNVLLWSERFGDPADPAVLLIMGTSTPGLGWPDELVDRLVSGGRHVIRFDHRDTGRSDCVDFAAHPYTLGDLAGDAVAVLDAYGIPAAHIAGASLGGAIAQWLAVHRPERVRTLTLIMTGPMGADAGPAWARALSGQEPDPDDLPPPAARFLDHIMRSATVPRTTREEHLAAGLETWRVLNGEVLPFDEEAARRLVQESYDAARDPAAAANHDLAGRVMTADRLVPLSSIKAPTLVVHGTEDPLRPLPHGEAVAGQIPGARLETIPGMGHSFLSPGLPRRIADLILRHTTA